MASGEAKEAQTMANAGLSNGKRRLNNGNAGLNNGKPRHKQ
jgi:hypothetical protein